MRKTKTMKWLFCMVSLLALPVLAIDLINEDFEGYALDGAVTDAADIGATYVRCDGVDGTVGNALNLTDYSAYMPSGGSNTLYVGDGSTSEAGGKTRWENAAQGAVSGTFSIDFNNYTGSYTGKMRLRAGNGAGAAVYVLLYHTGEIYILDGTSSILLTNTYSLASTGAGASSSLVIDFDAATGTYSGTLDGNPLVAATGGATSFSFYDDATFLNSIDVECTAEAPSRGQGMVDNLVLSAANVVDIVLNENFESYPVVASNSDMTNAAQIGASYIRSAFADTGGTSGEALVLKDYAAFMPGGGIRTLYIGDGSTSATGAVARWESSESAVNGTFSIDFNNYAGTYEGNLWMSAGDGTNMAFNIIAYRTGGNMYLHDWSTGISTLLTNTFNNASTGPGAVSHLEINFDAVAGTFSGTVDGNAIVADGTGATTFDFDVAVASLNSVQVESTHGTTSRGQGMVDNISIVTGGDSDGDGLPDSWELGWFGNLDTGPADLCANGFSTVEEAYVAGFDPTDFLNPGFVAAIADDAGNSVVQWTQAAGRVYTIKWTDDLATTPFTELESGYVGGAYTDTVHAADSEGFYKLEVDLAP